MSNDTRPPFLDFVPEPPKTLSARRAVLDWVAETWHFFLHTIRPTSRFLPPPQQNIGDINPNQLRLEPSDAPSVIQYVDAVRRLVESGEERLDTVRSKGNSLLGFVTLVTPVFAWWLLSGRDRLADAPLAAMSSNCVGVLAVCFLGLAVRALVRTQAVVGFDGPGIDMVIATDSASLTPYNLMEELRRLVLRWGQLQRWSDGIADHFRAGQRFLVIALLLSIVAGTICYLHADPPTSVIVVEKASPSPSPRSSPVIVIVAAAIVVLAMTVALALQLFLAFRFLKHPINSGVSEPTYNRSSDDRRGGNDL